MIVLTRQTIREIIRWAIFFITLIGLPIAYLKFLTLGTACWLCPFFNLQNLLIHIFQPSLWGYLGPSNLATMILVLGSIGFLLILTLALGRVFCSWICPFGTLLDFLGKFSVMILNVKRRELPEVVKDRNIKYGVLIGFLAIAVLLGRCAFCDLCPMGTFYRSVGPYMYSFPALLIFSVLMLLAIVGIAIIYSPRAWCKFLCPLGAFIALVDHGSWKGSRVQLPTHSCIECRQCEAQCPMEIPIMDQTKYRLINDPAVKKVLEEEGVPELLSKPGKFEKYPESVQAILLDRMELYKIQPGECIRCYQCVDICPIAKKIKAKEKAEA